MRAAPAFWGEPAGLLADLLSPIGAVCDAAGRLRRAISRSYCPAIAGVCVGNLVAGGAGKTPVTLALAAWLARRSVPVHVVSRGYGGRLRGPIRVDPIRHDASALGDEALLLASRAPCWVARDRAAGVRAAGAGPAAAGGPGPPLLKKGSQPRGLPNPPGVVAATRACVLAKGRKP